MLDTFRVKGPHGQHLCIVYDVLREPIGLTMEKLPGHMFGSDHLRKLLPALLQGLDYLHSECRIVHTDLKADNIMMGLGDSTILDRVVQDETIHPSPRKMPDSHGRIIYQSRSDFGDAPTDAVIASARITDIGLATWGDECHNHSIQSNAFTAPEVILAAGWSYPADIWNLGVMLWDLFENFGLFDAIDTGPSHYSSTQHLGLMIALMGPPPKELLDRGSTSATYFDSDGQFRHPKLIREGFSFESSITRFKGEDKELFIDFTKKMICWLPGERWTAKQLLQHPWLKEREQREDRALSPASKLESDVKPADVTVVTAKTTKETNSMRRSTSSSFFKNDVNTASSDVIRAILDR
jgi:serine/threonine-protein kinase SRPK3